MLKKVFVQVLAVAALAGCAHVPNARPATDVASATEKLRQLMVNPTRPELEALVADELSYGHSAGKVDTKASFIGDLLSGASDFVTIDITDETRRQVRDVAIVRHTLSATTNDNGKPGTVTIKVLQVWQHTDGQWRLIARQAVRPPQ